MHSADAPKPDSAGQADKPAAGLIFATTRWSIILRAKEDGTAGAAALETLCRAYWHPLHSYLVRKGYSHADADDLTQEFFAGLLRRNSLSKVVPERGRFRNFLLVSLRNFLSDTHDRAKAVRRGGGILPISLDGVDEEGGPAIEPADQLTPEQAFEKQWAQTVLARAREILRTECIANNKQAVYDALGPEGADTGETYVEIAERLGLSEEGVKSAAFRLRRRYRELIRAEVAETVENEEDLEEELRHLLRVLEN